MAQLLAPATLSYEEFLTQYDGQRAEWVDGVIEPMSPVSRRHQHIGGFLYQVISLFADTKGLGQVFYSEFQMRLASLRRGREPDILFVRTENLPRIQTNYLDGPADLVVEIVSPESAQRDRVTKFREYEQAGVGEYWLIDPLTQTVSFFVRDADGRYQSAALDGDGRYHCAALPGLWLRAHWLWQEPLPPVLGVLKEWGLI